MASRKRKTGWRVLVLVAALAPFGGAGPVGATSSGPADPGGTLAPTSFWLAVPGGTVYGSPGALALDKPIVGMATTPDGKGYWLVAADGGIFAYGDAQFYGSTGGLALNQPIVGMASTPDGHGYWLVASDGGIFAYGDAQFYGSTATAPTEPAQKIVAAPASPAGEGYWIVDQNGTQYPFGPGAAGDPPTDGVVFNPVTPGDKAVQFALLQLNKPYIWGGNGPVGYDCSGLALASWEHADGISFARVADDQYHTAGSPVALASLQAGDLVFWGTKQTAWTTVYHTGIYIGGDQSVQATGDQVQLDQLGTYSPTGSLMPNGRRP